MAHTEAYLRSLSPASHEAECAACAFADPDNPTQVEVEARLACQECRGFGRRFWAYWTRGANGTCHTCWLSSVPVMVSPGPMGQDKVICLNCQLSAHGTGCACGDPSWVASDP